MMSNMFSKVNKKRKAQKKPDLLSRMAKKKKSQKQTAAAAAINARQAVMDFHLSQKATADMATRKKKLVAEGQKRFAELRVEMERMNEMAKSGKIDAKQLAAEKKKAMDLMRRLHDEEHEAMLAEQAETRKRLDDVLARANSMIVHSAEKDAIIAKYRELLAQARGTWR